MVATSFTFIIADNSAATSITFTPPTDMKAPVPAGTDLGLVLVSPSTWSGLLLMSGANADSFTVSTLADGPHVLTTKQLGAGSYAATITPSP